MYPSVALGLADWWCVISETPSIIIIIIINQKQIGCYSFSTVPGTFLPTTYLMLCLYFIFPHPYNNIILYVCIIVWTHRSKYFKVDLASSEQSVLACCAVFCAFSSHQTMIDDFFDDPFATVIVCLLWQCYYNYYIILTL